MAKDTETKLKFIELSAKGKSYRTIAAELGIAPSTCYTWNKELSADIDRLKQERIAEIYEAQELSRAARLEQLAKHRSKIIAALEAKDYSDTSTDKLADMLLKADKAIAEYGDQERTEQGFTDYFTEINRLYLDLKNNRITAADLKARLSIINTIESGRGGLDFDINLAPKEIPEEEYLTSSADDAAAVFSLYDALTSENAPQQAEGQ